MLTIAVIAFDRISSFHLSVPCMVFGVDKLHPQVPAFRVVVCAAERGKLMTNSGFEIKPSHDLSELNNADIVVVPSWRDPEEMPSKVLLQALQQAHQRGSTIVGLCLGTFVLAAAGLLNGKSATTHWGWSNQLQQLYPQIKVNPDVLYIDEGDILTSAGVAAGIDCCLHLLRQRFGADIANCVARRMVVSPHRHGGQAQFIEHAIPPTPKTDRMASLLDDIRANLAQQYNLDGLAERTRMSRRTFTRQFQKTTGTSFAQWLLSERLRLAQRLLETTDTAIELIANQVGFLSALSLRQHFQAKLGTTPTRYRKEFRGI